MDEQRPNDMGIGMDPTTLGEVGSPVEPVEQVETLDVTPIMPTPEKQEELGKNPPPEKKPKQPMNKGIFILLIVTLIVGIAYGVYWFLSQGNSVDKRVQLKSVVVTLGEELSTNLEDYAVFDSSINPNNCVLDVKAVDTSKEGTYDYKIICGDKEYPGKLEVKDLLELAVELKEVYVVKDGELKADDFFISCNKEICTYSFVKEEETLALLKSAGGPHDIELKVMFGEKELLVTGKLTVTESEIKAYLECTSPSDKVEEYNARKAIMDRFVIGVVNDKNVFLNIASRNYIYVIDTEENYNAIKKDLEGKNEFDKIVGTISFKDAEKQVIVTVNLLKSALDIEYPPAFPSEYTQIKDLYTAKSYVCAPKDV